VEILLVKFIKEAILSYERDFSVSQSFYVDLILRGEKCLVGRFVGCGALILWFRDCLWDLCFSRFFQYMNPLWIIRVRNAEGN